MKNEVDMCFKHIGFYSIIQVIYLCYFCAFFNSSSTSEQIICSTSKLYNPKNYGTQKNAT